MYGHKNFAQFFFVLNQGKKVRRAMLQSILRLIVSYQTLKVRNINYSDLEIAADKSILRFVSDVSLKTCFPFRIRSKVSNLRSLISFLHSLHNHCGLVR